MTFGLTYLVIGVVVALGMRRGIAEAPVQPQPTEETPLPKVSLEKHPTTSVSLEKHPTTQMASTKVNLTKSTDPYIDTARKIQASEDVPVMNLDDLLNDGSDF